jgi:hypothetical protein
MKLSPAQKELLDRMGDGYRLMQPPGRRPRLVKPGAQPIDTNVRTIKALVAQQKLTTTEPDKGGYREWTIVPENVYTETCICRACGSGLWSRRTGPRSFTCLWCTRAWTELPVPEPEMAR